MSTSKSTRRIAMTFMALLFTAGLSTAGAVNCTCKLTLKEHRFSNSNDYRALEISKLTSYQRTEQFDQNINITKSCKAHCKEAFGIESSGVSPAAAKAKKRLLGKATKYGQPFNWCGGWLSAQLDSRGSFGWRYDIAPGLIGISPVRVCSSVPPGLAKSCCCGSNHLTVFRDFPNYEWAISPEGHFLRFWWNQQAHSEVVKYNKFTEPLVSGSLRRDPFGDGAVALNEDGFVVRTTKKSGKWTSEFVARQLIHNFGGVLPCGMFSTLRPDFRAIWVITESRIVRLELKQGKWVDTSVSIGANAVMIDPSSLYEIGNGRIAGALKDGQRWNVWFKDNDPNQIRFDYSLGKIAPSPSAQCSIATNSLRPLLEQNDQE